MDADHRGKGRTARRACTGTQSHTATSRNTPSIVWHSAHHVRCCGDFALRMEGDHEVRRPAFILRTVEPRLKPRLKPSLCCPQVHGDRLTPAMQPAWSGATVCLCVPVTSTHWSASVCVLSACTAGCHTTCRPLLRRRTRRTRGVARSEFGTHLLRQRSTLLPTRSLRVHVWD